MSEVRILKFRVLDPSGASYSVRAGSSAPGEIWMSCSCRGARASRCCRHRLALLFGNVKDLLSGNEDDVATLAAIIKGTETERRVVRVAELRDVLELAKREVSRAEASLAKALIAERPCPADRDKTGTRRVAPALQAGSLVEA